MKDPDTAILMKAQSSRKKASKNTIECEPIALTVISGATTATTAAASTVTNTIEPPVTKRGQRKKSFPVVAVVTANGIQGTLMPEKKKPLIAHLPFSSTEVLFNDGPVAYDPRPPVQPEPFDQMEDAFDTAAAISDVYTGVFHMEEENTVSNTVDTRNEIKTIAEPVPVFTKMDLNLYSRENGAIEVPETTEIACFWCAHQFDGRPVFLPYDEKNGVWHVYGNFCCPECALAYCLDEKEDQQTRWEKVALLHRLYANVVGGRIYPAPSRNVLKLFGGRLSIQEYRATVRKGKVRMDIHYPPMVSLLATMDTKPIDFYETTIPKTFVPLNTERVKKVEEGLRLKRSKPLKDKESTLDACMNLQIKRA